ncbi:MAG: cytidine deaminase [Nocardiopsaceae bacterium]|nr:cytidine deaminase [Nocardiopsaceae bacterium]
MRYTTLDQLEAGQAELLRAAREVAPRAFNPVSRFQVGAAVRDVRGNVYVGTNFESSALPLGVCAEPAALLAAISAGSRELTTIAVVGGDPAGDGKGAPVTPCGGCRQRIFDATGGAATTMRVLCSNLALGSVLDVTITELLPYPFGSSVLPAAAWEG